MKNAKSSHVSLSAGTTFKLQRLASRKVALVCSQGTAWITNPGDQKDYIIRPGETLNLEVKSRRAPVVIGSVSGPLELDVISA